ncbi:MAG: hypothetical protein JXR63_12590 [Spirochaetales bacterium]|nr:hypothetical protein [Spirochaetales bacterium]
MNKKIIFLFIILSLSNFVFAFSSENENLAIKSYIEDLQQAEPPTIISNHIIFSYKPTQQISTVYAVFSHENFQKLNTFAFYEKINMYILIYPIPQDIDFFHYRLNINGLWSIDKNNPNKEFNRHGFEMSKIYLNELKYDKEIKTPQQITGNRYKFIYTGRPNSKITIAGDFNGWDPFMYRMKEITAGIYEIELNINNEEFFYYFLDNGKKVLDSFNTQKKYLSIQGEVNFYSKNSIF